MQTVGRIMLIAGIAIAILGGLLLLLARFSFFGNLPGDIRVEREGFSLFFPLTSMILFSIVVSIILNIILRLINRS
jgi:hypothetical protein